MNTDYKAQKEEQGKDALNMILFFFVGIPAFIFIIALIFSA